MRDAETAQEKNVGSGTLQAVTVAVSNKGLNNLFKYISPQLLGESFTAPSMSALSSPVEIPSTYQRIDVNSINLSGGQVSQINIASTPTVTFTTSGIPCVSLNGSFHIAYAHWYESGSTFTQGNTSSTPYSITSSQFHFDISAIDLSFDIDIATTNMQWTVTVTNPQQSNVQVANVNIPGNSELKGSDLSCVTGKVDQQVSNMLQDHNYASSLAGAVNGLLSTIPDSGHLTTAIVYQFSPSCAPTYPDNAGVALGITGGVLYNDTSYPGSPVSVPIPAINANLDVTMNLSAYEISALLWAAYQNGDLNVTVSQETVGSLPQLNTSYYETIWPAFYALGPAAGTPIEVVISAAAAPSVSVLSTWCITDAVYAALKSQVDANTYAALAQMCDVIYFSSSDFANALSTYLTAAEVTQYSSIITAAAAGDPALSVPLEVKITVNILSSGSYTSAFSFTINRSNVLANLGLQNPTGTKDVLYFSFTQNGQDTVSDISCVPALEATVNETLMTVIWLIFAANLDTALQKLGKTGVPLPNISGLCLGSPEIGLHSSCGGYLSLGANIQQA